jgi:hypothetical protein
MATREEQRAAGVAYIQAHPERSDRQLAEELGVSRPTVSSWRRVAGVRPRRYAAPVGGGSDVVSPAPIGAPVEADRIPTWNEAIVTLLRYADDRRYPDYALDLQASADEVEQQAARATSIRRMMDRLDAYCTILDPEKRGRR